MIPGDLGKVLVFFGLGIAALGFILWAGGGLFNLGRLPGDIVIRRGNFTFYFPIVTSIVLSLVLTFVLSFLFRR